MNDRDALLELVSDAVRLHRVSDITKRMQVEMLKLNLLTDAELEAYEEEFVETNKTAVSLGVVNREQHGLAFAIYKKFGYGAEYFEMLHRVYEGENNVV